MDLDALPSFGKQAYENYTALWIAERAAQEEVEQKEKGWKEKEERERVVIDLTGEDQNANGREKGQGAEQWRGVGRTGGTQQAVQGRNGLTRPSGVRPPASRGRPPFQPRVPRVLTKEEKEKKIWDATCTHYRMAGPSWPALTEAFSKALGPGTPKGK